MNKRYTGPDGRPDEDPTVAVVETAEDTELARIKSEAEADKAVGMKPVSGQTDWEKRYADLRSLTARKENEAQRKVAELVEEMASLKAQLNSKAASPDAFVPTSDEEIAAWRSQHPEAFRMVKTLVNKEAEDRIKALEDELAIIRNERGDAQQEAAIARLKARVPDLDAIQADPAFWDWLDARPKFKDTVLNTLDVDATADILAAFKAVSGKSSSKRTHARTYDELAAADTGRSSRVDPPVTDTSGYLYRESEIRKMSDKEFDKQEEKIKEAYRTGKVLMDVR